MKIEEGKGGKGRRKREEKLDERAKGLQKTKENGGKGGVKQRKKSNQG